MKYKKEKEVYIDTKDLIDALAWLYENEIYKNKVSAARFNIKEFYFIRDLIFLKPKELVFHYVADYIMNRTVVKKMPILNTPSLRRLSFILNFLTSKSAKEAAIKAGYSSKTAKQQACRLLREIQGHKREY